MDQELGALIGRLEALFAERTGLEPVRRWKQAHPQRKAVGYLPVYPPRELIHAAGCLPVGLTGNPRSEHDGNCCYPSLVDELQTVQKLDVLDAFVVSHHCSTMGEVVDTLGSRAPDRPVISFSGQVGRGHRAAEYERQLWQLRGSLEQIAGQSITDAQLLQSIELYNENRQLIENLYQSRQVDPGSFPCSEVYLVLQAGNLLPVEEHNALLRSYLELAGCSGRDRDDNLRLFLRGSFCEQPPLTLIKTIEAAGCVIVDDDLLLSSRWRVGGIEVSGDPMFALAEAMVDQVAESPARHDDIGLSIDLVEKAREDEAVGVIFTVPAGCSPASADHRKHRPTLAKAGLSSLELAGDADQPQIHQQVRGFVAELRAQAR